MRDSKQARDRSDHIRRLVRWFLGFNVALFVLVGSFALIKVWIPASLAQPLAQAEPAAVGGLDGTVALAAALATGVATLGAGLAVGMTGSAALGTVAERPEAFGRSLIFVGLAEGIAIYGLIVSFLILSQ